MESISNINNLELDKATTEASFKAPEIDKNVNSLINKNQDLHYLYKQAPIGIVLNIISALLITWFVMPQVADYFYMPWLIFTLIISFTHTLLIKEFNKNKQNLHVNNQWAIYHTFMVGLTALVFSAGYLIFLPAVDTFVQTVLLLTLATLAVSFLPVLSIFLPSYIIYISAFIFPFVYWIYSLPPDSSYPLAALLTVTYCMLIIVASYYSSALIEAFSLAGQVNEQAKKLRIMLEEKNTDNIKLKRDIYELGKYSDAALRQKEQAEITLQSINEGVISTDQFGKVTYINCVAEVFTGMQMQETDSRKIGSVINLIDENTHLELPNPVLTCLEKRSLIQDSKDVLLVRRDGLEYAIDYSVNPIMTEKGDLKGAVMIFRDVTEKRKLEKTLDWQDKHDALTGLINRNEFNQRLIHLITNSENRENEHALCLIDLDRFRLINDTCGAGAGDELLKKIANRLRSLTRDTDMLARIANDEFAIIMYSCAIEKAKLIAEIFREEINKLRFEWEDRFFSVSASIGIVSISPETTDDISKIYRNAEIACHKARAGGGNSLQIFTEDMTEQRKYTGQMKLLVDLQKNLEQESFKLCTQRIQPLDDLNDTVINEILLRMKNESGVLLSANNFIHTAETYQMLAEIDKWVLKLVMELIAYGNPVFKESNLININISKQSILNDKFTEYLKQLLEDYEVSTPKICFEINESHFYGKVNSLQRFVTIVKKLGCKVALDEFNYNPEAIHSARNLDMDFVKLDARQFEDINDEKGFNYTLLESINNIHHMVGAQTIVKCLDNDEMIEQLYEIGTDYVQGFAVAKPSLITNGMPN